LAIGLPSFVALVGILVNEDYFVALNVRLSSVEDKLDTLTGRVAEVDNRVCCLLEPAGPVRSRVG
jgi:hypothetical protein